jgi:RNA polymerase sigma-70 factor (ECF subfamily)
MLGNVEEAEEAVQDAFVRVFHAHDRFRGEAKLATWVSRIVINACLTRLKRPDRVKQGEVPLEKADKELDESLEDLELFSAEPETEFMGNILAELPGRQASAISLYYFHGYDYREIASAMNISQAAVTSLLERGRRELENLIEERRKESAR